MTSPAIGCGPGPLLGSRASRPGSGTPSNLAFAENLGPFGLTAVLTEPCPWEPGLAHAVPGEERGKRGSCETEMAWVHVMEKEGVGLRARKRGGKRKEEDVAKWTETEGDNACAWTRGGVCLYEVVLVHYNEGERSGLEFVPSTHCATPCTFESRLCPRYMAYIVCIAVLVHGLAGLHKCARTVWSCTSINNGKAILQPSSCVPNTLAECSSFSSCSRTNFINEGSGHAQT